MANREVIDMLKSYVLLLNTEVLSVREAYLFSSYSSGAAKEQSDIDIVLVLDRYDENDDAVIGKVWRLTRKISRRIEPFLISTKKFYNDNTSPVISSSKAYCCDCIN